MGIAGLVIEITALITAWLVYQQGYGVGPDGAMPMLLGIAIGCIGLTLGGMLGALGIVFGLLRTKRVPKTAAAATLLPLVILLLLATRTIGPL